jgi:hypothetical protein
MTPKRRGTVFLLTLCCTLSLLLASCGSNKLSMTGGSTAHTTDRLSTLETATSTATTNMTGGFVGSDSSRADWIGLSSNGHRLVAFTSDGMANKPPTFAQWFRGTIKNNSVDASTNNGDHLTVQMAQDTANGTVTLKNGKTFPFVAKAVPMNASTAGLYTSERTINGQQYLAGWVVVPPEGTPLTATPGATGTATLTPSATGTETVTPAATGTTTLTPSTTGTATLTPGATGTSTVTPGTLQSAGAIINQQTGKVMQAPALTPQDLASKKVTVPDLGTFNLRQCQPGQC